MPALPPIFDGHNDTLTRLFPLDKTPPQSIIDHGTEGHLDVPRAGLGGFAGGFFALFIRNQRGKDPGEPVRDDAGAWSWTPASVDRGFALEQTLRLLDEVDAMFDAHGDQLMRCLDMNDLRNSLVDARLGVLLHIEGAGMLSPDCAELPMLYDRGIRSIGPVWSRPNVFATGIRFGWPSTNDLGPGLTQAGRRLVRECERLGIAIDLSHLNLKGFMDVAKVATRPLIATHCAAHALCASARNLTDEQLKLIAESAGVVGVNFYTGDLRGDGRNDTDMPLSRLIDHIMHMVELMGPDHVALGSDFDGAKMCDELSDTRGLPKVLRGLLDRGVSDEALSKIANANWLRVLEQHLKATD